MLSYSGYAQKSILRLSQQTLMHEVRETPSPLDGQHIAVNPPRFMWPDKFPHLGPVLDGVEGEFSFEERMGCGFGACMGCSCKTVTGYKRICKDGPVLEKKEILWK